MELAKILIENFRHIEHLEVDFTDPLDRVRKTSLLVGPNTCGKTTILDAIAAALSPSLELPALRPGLRITPRTIVRRGTLHAKVVCHVRFSADEIRATREVFALAEKDWVVPDDSEVKLTWMYPDPRNKSAFGFTEYEPRWCWTHFKGRVSIARLLATGRASRNWFKRVGGVCTFDQQRTGMGKTIPRHIWNLIHCLEDGDEPEAHERRTSDPRTILLSLAMQSLLPPRDVSNTDDFAFIRETYARVCSPHILVGAVRDDMGTPELLFNNGQYDYSYEGLSSGEQMMLLVLIRMMTENVHRSIVLVDEVELHQHPIWQRKLFHLLSQIGEFNQLIATTHSPYLREVVPRDVVVDLGLLQEQSMQEASVS